MQFKRYIIGLAIAAGLATPATASAATGSIVVQPGDGNQVTADVSVTATDADSYYGQSYWFAYVLQIDGTQVCNSTDGDVAMLSTSLTDGLVPRDSDGHFNVPGTYSTVVTFAPTHSPQTRICLYASTLGNRQQLVAESVVATTTTGRYRIGAICNDGWHSSATGSGACSSHGGVRYWLYSDGTVPTPTPTPESPIVATPVPPTPPAVAPQPEINSGVVCNGKPVKTPRSCSIRAGRVKLSRLSWRTWGKTAKATGKVSFDGSKPRKATIALSQPKAGVYTKMTIKVAHGKTRHLTLRSN
jgi:hypothetical protein